MTNRDKLVELIDEVAEADTIKRGGEWVEVINTDEIADHLLANGVTVNNWRDAKTDPPKKWRYSNGRLVDFLVHCHGGRVCVGNYLGEAKRWVTVGVPALAIGWQQLPKPSKEE